ncbi:hypothetical protein, partial [Pseudomonas aeruginosa]|uniref:hypothetical protein n=1 Tax=Pseudomonas aeruginosa TaxID=287 RepID=UPI001C3D017E
KKSRGTSRIVTDAITIQNPRNRGGSTGHVLAKRSVTFTEIRRATIGRRRSVQLGEHITEVRMLRSI